MKIAISSGIKEIPAHVGKKGFCVYGPPNEKLQEWIDFHKFEVSILGAFYNIEVPDGYPLSECFETPVQYEYVDGFSPNLNKYLHLGHVSNFVLAKAFQKMGIGKKFIANLGDTLTGEVTKENALKAYHNYLGYFDYTVDKIFYASELTGVDDLLSPGEGDYEGTQIFPLNPSIVGRKSDSSTTYFYQDVALQAQLRASTLYMTGSEQAGHFNALKKCFWYINHIPLGLVTLNGSKMSSSTGNVIMFTEVIDILYDKLQAYDSRLVWNVLAGYILKSTPSSPKNIATDSLDNVKESQGLYLSYTLAKLKSAGMVINSTTSFNDTWMDYKLIKAKTLLQPNILFDATVDIAKKISVMYIDHTIKDSPENQALFQPLADDMLHGMELLGMFNIDRV